MSEAGLDTLMVFTSLPDRATAVRLARMLVDRRLAACVNVLGEASSVYRWQGQIESEQEVPMLIKTRAALYDEVQAAIVGSHPYELPEVVAVPVVRGLPEYLEWVVAETTPSTE